VNKYLLLVLLLVGCAPPTYEVNCTNLEGDTIFKMDKFEGYSSDFEIKYLLGPSEHKSFGWFKFPDKEKILAHCEMGGGNAS